MYICICIPYQSNTNKCIIRTAALISEPTKSKHGKGLPKPFNSTVDLGHMSWMCQGFLTPFFMLFPVHGER
jgi:hypothetical protein